MRASVRSGLLAASLLATGALRGQAEQYRSPAGVTYRALADTGTIARAEAALAGDSLDVDKLLALGLAQASMRQYREAIATFTRGIRLAPTNATLYRWRGHRHLSIREFGKARADLRRAIALDSTNYGAWYHLGVLRFAEGDFPGAVECFTHSLPHAPDPGERAASTDWLWMSLSRAGRAPEAAALLARRPDSIATTVAYARRLRMYRGELAPEQLLAPTDTTDIDVATLNYGLGNWYVVHGDAARARAAFERAVASGGWPAFGFIVAEAELRRR